MQGEQGDVGDTGPIGPSGGEQGVQGVAGADGVDGINGADGNNGSQGVQGPQGVAGLDGSDGSDAPNKFINLADTISDLSGHDGEALVISGTNITSAPFSSAGVEGIRLGAQIIVGTHNSVAVGKNYTAAAGHVITQIYQAVKTGQYGYAHPYIAQVGARPIQKNDSTLGWVTVTGV